MNIKSLRYKQLVLTTICFLFAIISFAQRSYNYNIAFPGDALDRKELTIHFYQGYQVVSLQNDSSNSFSGSSDSHLKYPILEIIYNSSKSGFILHQFFLEGKSFDLQIHYDSVRDNIMVRNTKGLLTFAKAGEEEFQGFAKDEVKRNKEFWKQFSNEISNNDSATLSQLDTITGLLKDKQLTFAINNPWKPFSFFLLMTSIIGDPRYSKDSLFKLYNTSLKSEYKNTFEGRYITEMLAKNRLGIKTDAPYSNLVFKDLDGNSRTINSFKGKPLIVTIWATWCVPCVEELPTLKRIYSAYKGKVEMLSFSTDTKEDKLRTFVSSQNMNWVNVFDRSDLARIYGSDRGIPQVYLLDKKGKIVYFRAANNDYTLSMLEVQVQQQVDRKINVLPPTN